MTLHIDASKFLDTIFYDVPASQHVCVAKQFREEERGADGQKIMKTSFWHMDPDHKYFQKWASHKGKAAMEWYFCVSSVDGEMNEKGTALRRTEANCVEVWCLVLDIDDDEEKIKGLPPVEPSWKLESSPGNYQWGYLLEPDTRLGQYKSLVAWCGDQGWTDPGAEGYHRVMRIPGSANMKEGRGKFRSVIVEWAPDRSWTLDALAEALGTSMAQLPALALSSKGRGKAGGAGVAAGAGNVVVDKLVAAMSDAGVLQTTDEGQEWLEVKCPMLHGAHSDGSNTMFYSPLGRGEGQMAMIRGIKCHHAHCKPMTSRDFLTYLNEELSLPWVRAFDPIPYMQQRFVYVTEGDRVADIQRREEGVPYLMKLAEFSNLYAQRVQPDRDRAPVLAKVAWLEDEETVKVSRTLYEPNYPSSVLVPDGPMMALNKFKWPVHAASSAIPTVFLAHLDYLLPVPGEKELFLDWLAYKLQNPAKRSWGIIMVAHEAYGTGRSWLRHMMQLVWGKAAVKTIKLAKLTGAKGEVAYGDWASEIQMAVIEEAAAAVDKNDAHEKLFEQVKQLIDPAVGDMEINRKYGTLTQEAIYFNVMIMSNHREAMHIPEGEDRRIAVFTNPVKRKSSAYYVKLWGSLEGEGGGEVPAIYHLLMNRDVSAFNAWEAPGSSAKENLIEAMISPFDQVRAFVVENALGDIVTKKLLRDMVSEAAREMGFENLISHKTADQVAYHQWREMAKLSPGKSGRRIEKGGLRIEVRALRNHDDWYSETPGKKGGAIGGKMVLECERNEDAGKRLLGKHLRVIK